MAEELREFEVRVRDVGERLDQFLARVMHEHSRSFVQKLIEDGDVLVDGVSHRRSYRVSPGEEIVVRVPEPEPSEVLAQDLPLEIVYQDADLLVVNKAAGVVVHPNENDRQGTLVNALLYHVDDLSGIRGVEQPGIVHRIDKDTTGLLVVAKRDHAHRHLSDQFREHSIERAYAAITWGAPRPAEGTIESSIGRHPRDRKKMSSMARQGKLAVTHYRVVEDFGPAALVECRLETGRTHQIRVHLSEAHHPLVGDPVYGGTNSSWLPRDPVLRALMAPLHGQLLHASSLGFIHPSTDQFISFRCSPPEPMAGVLRALRAYAGLDPDGPGPWSELG